MGIKEPKQLPHFVCFHEMLLLSKHVKVCHTPGACSYLFNLHKNTVEYYHHFPHEETEGQQDHVKCPSHTAGQAYLRPKFRSV